MNTESNGFTITFTIIVAFVIGLYMYVLISLSNANAETKRLKDRYAPRQIMAYKAGVIDGMTIINGLSQGVYTNATQASNAWVAMQASFEMSIVE